MSISTLNDADLYLISMNRCNKLFKTIVLQNRYHVKLFQVTLLKNKVLQIFVYLPQKKPHLNFVPFELNQFRLLRLAMTVRICAGAQVEKINHIPHERKCGG